MAEKRSDNIAALRAKASVLMKELNAKKTVDSLKNAISATKRIFDNSPLNENPLAFNVESRPFLYNQDEGSDTTIKLHDQLATDGQTRTTATLQISGTSATRGTEQMAAKELTFNRRIESSENKITAAVNQRVGSVYANRQMNPSSVNQQQKPHATIYRCKWCPMVYVTMTDLTRHCIAHERAKGHNILVCDTCSLRTDSADILEMHLREHYRSQSRRNALVDLLKKNPSAKIFLGEIPVKPKFLPHTQVWVHSSTGNVVCEEVHDSLIAFNAANSFKPYPKGSQSSSEVSYTSAPVPSGVALSGYGSTRTCLSETVSPPTNLLNNNTYNLNDSSNIYRNLDIQNQPLLFGGEISHPPRIYNDDVTNTHILSSSRQLGSNTAAHNFPKTEPTVVPNTVEMSSILQSASMIEYPNSRPGSSTDGYSETSTSSVRSSPAFPHNFCEYGNPLIPTTKPASSISNATTTSSNNNSAQPSTAFSATVYKASGLHSLLKTTTASVRNSIAAASSKVSKNQGSQGFVCKLCGEVAELAKNPMARLIKHHMSVHTVIEGQWKHCFLCSFQTDHKQLLREHIKQHYRVGNMFTHVKSILGKYPEASIRFTEERLTAEELVEKLTVDSNTPIQCPVMPLMSSKQNCSTLHSRKTMSSSSITISDEDENESQGKCDVPSSDRGPTLNLTNQIIKMIDNMPVINIEPIGGQVDSSVEPTRQYPEAPHTVPSCTQRGISSSVGKVITKPSLSSLGVASSQYSTSGKNIPAAPFPYTSMLRYPSPTYIANTQPTVPVATSQNYNGVFSNVSSSNSYFKPKTVGSVLMSRNAEPNFTTSANPSHKGPIQQQQQQTYNKLAHYQQNYQQVHRPQPMSYIPNVYTQTQQLQYYNQQPPSHNISTCQNSCFVNLCSTSSQSSSTTDSSMCCNPSWNSLPAISSSAQLSNSTGLNDYQILERWLLSNLHLPRLTQSVMTDLRTKTKLTAATIMEWYNFLVARVREHGLDLRNCKKGLSFEDQQLTQSVIFPFLSEATKSAIMTKDPRDNYLGTKTTAYQPNLQLSTGNLGQQINLLQQPAQTYTNSQFSHNQLQQQSQLRPQQQQSDSSKQKERPSQQQQQQQSEPLPLQQQPSLQHQQLSLQQQQSESLQPQQQLVSKSSTQPYSSVLQLLPEPDQQINLLQQPAQTYTNSQFLHNQLQQQPQLRPQQQQSDSSKQKERPSQQQQQQQSEPLPLQQQPSLQHQQLSLQQQQSESLQPQQQLVSKSSTQQYSSVLQLLPEPEQHIQSTKQTVQQPQQQIEDQNRMLSTSSFNQELESPKPVEKQTTVYSGQTSMTEDAKLDQPINLETLLDKSNLDLLMDIVKDTAPEESLSQWYSTLPSQQTPFSASNMQTEEPGVRYLEQQSGTNYTGNSVTSEASVSSLSQVFTKTSVQSAVTDVSIVSSLVSASNKITNTNDSVSCVAGGPSAVSNLTCSQSAPNTFRTSCIENESNVPHVSVSYKGPTSTENIDGVSARCTQSDISNTSNNASVLPNTSNTSITNSQDESLISLPSVVEKRSDTSAIQVATEPNAVGTDVLGKDTSTNNITQGRITQPMAVPDACEGERLSLVNADLNNDDCHQLQPSPNASPRKTDKLSDATLANESMNKKVNTDSSSNFEANEATNESLTNKIVHVAKSNKRKRLTSLKDGKAMSVGRSDDNTAEMCISCMKLECNCNSSCKLNLYLSANDNIQKETSEIKEKHLHRMLYPIVRVKRLDDVKLKSIHRTEYLDKEVHTGKDKDVRDKQGKNDTNNPRKATDNCERDCEVKSSDNEKLDLLKNDAKHVDEKKATHDEMADVKGRTLPSRRSRSSERGIVSPGKVNVEKNFTIDVRRSSFRKQLLVLQNSFQPTIKLETDLISTTELNSDRILGTVKTEEIHDKNAVQKIEVLDNAEDNESTEAKSEGRENCLKTLESEEKSKSGSNNSGKDTEPDEITNITGTKRNIKDKFARNERIRSKLGYINKRVDIKGRNTLTNANYGRKVKRAIGRILRQRSTLGQNSLRDDENSSQSVINNKKVPTYVWKDIKVSLKRVITKELLNTIAETGSVSVSDLNSKINQRTCRNLSDESQIKHTKMALLTKDRTPESESDVRDVTEQLESASSDQIDKPSYRGSRGSNWNRVRSSNKSSTNLEYIENVPHIFGKDLRVGVNRLTEELENSLKKSGSINVLAMSGSNERVRTKRDLTIDNIEEFQPRVTRSSYLTSNKLSDKTGKKGKFHEVTGNEVKIALTRMVTTQLGNSKTSSIDVRSLIGNTEQDATELGMTTVDKSRHIKTSDKELNILALRSNSRSSTRRKESVGNDQTSQSGITELRSTRSRSDINTQSKQLEEETAKRRAAECIKARETNKKSKMLLKESANDSEKLLLLLKELLEDPECESVNWVRKGRGHFRINDSVKVALRWGKCIAVKASTKRLENDISKLVETKMLMKIRSHKYDYRFADTGNSS